MAASSGGAAAAGAAASPLLVSVNGSAEYVSVLDLESFRTTQKTTFQRKDADGPIPPGPPQLVSGATISGLVTFLGLSTSNVQGVTISTPGVDDVALSAAEVDAGFPGASADPCSPHCQAFLTWDYDGGRTVQFSRPERGAGDYNGNYGGTSDGNVLTVAITTSGGAVIPMSLTASTVNPDAGQSVHFSLAPGTALPPNTKLSWDFGDGTAPVKNTSSDSDISQDHAFPANGTYPVTLTAIATDGSHGRAPLSVQVGPVSPNASVASTPQAPTNAAAGGGSGGNGSGGGTAATGSGTGGAKSAATGAAKGSAKGDSSTKTGKSAGTSTKKSGTAVPRSGDQTPAPAQQPATAGSTGSAAGSVGAGAASAATTPASSTTPTSTTPAATTPGTTPAPFSATPPAAGGPTRISGFAVNERGPNIAAALAAADALAVQTPPRAAARAAAGHGTTIAGGVTGGLVIIGLLGLGAAREWRRLPKALPT